MKLPKFDHDKARWDMYQRWHNVHPGGYVQFDTGEAIFTAHRHRPASRVHQHIPGVMTFMPLDLAKHPHRFQSLKFTTPDGTPVKRTWLVAGQMFLLDLDTKRVVAINRGGRWPETVPHKIRQRASVYFPGDGLPPISGGEVHVWRPDELTKDQKQHIETLRASCKAWRDMADDEEKWTDVRMVNSYGPPKQVIAETYTINFYMIPRQPIRADLLLNVSFATLPKLHRHQLAAYGYTAPTVHEYHAHLNVEGIDTWARAS